MISLDMPAEKAVFVATACMVMAEEYETPDIVRALLLSTFEEIMQKIEGEQSGNAAQVQAPGD